ncbi:MAG: undecaprenyl-diphosphate phosphatase [Bacteriovoracia bacterium]
MSDFLLAAILGVVEGITEFLPISSTAHLRIAQHFLGLSLENEFWKLFAIFIQLGAILSVVVIYRRKLLGFARKPFQKAVYLILVAFLCTAIPAFLLKKVIGANLESIFVMMMALGVGGIVMILVDKVFTRGVPLEQMGYGQAAFIGFCQVLSAVFPGTSRSMSTIASGQVAGLTRAAALEFSFLVSIPVMAVATLYDLLKYLKATPAGLGAHELALLMVGFVVSFVVAYAVIVWFLDFVRKHGFLAFGIYRIALAALLFFIGG